MCSTSTQQCALGLKCSNWGWPVQSRCHGKTGEGGSCWSDADCNSVDLHCLGSSGLNPGTCRQYPTMGQACGTSTTFPSCQSSGSGCVSCNYSTARCEKCTQTVYITIPRGGACDYANTTSCDNGLYCEMNSHQPPLAPYVVGHNVGTCQPLNNVPSGGNCSSTNSCPRYSSCTRVFSNGVYVFTCGNSTLNSPCDPYSNLPDYQICPSSGGYSFYCRCDKTCQLQVSSGTSSGSCYSANSVASSYFWGTSVPSISPALAQLPASYQRALANYYCCMAAQSGCPATLASQNGVIMDCGSLSFSIPSICDAKGTNQGSAVLGCANFVPQQLELFSGAAVVAPSFLLLILSLFFLL